MSVLVQNKIQIFLLFCNKLSEVELWTQLKYMKYWPIPNLRFYSLSISYCNEVST